MKKSTVNKFESLSREELIRACIVLEDENAQLRPTPAWRDLSSVYQRFRMWRVCCQERLQMVIYLLIGGVLTLVSLWVAGYICMQDDER